LYGSNVANKEPVKSIASIVSIATRASLSDDVVYKITKAFWESAKENYERYPWLRNVKLEEALKDLNAPLHPGAAKYYQEIGMTLPAELIPPKEAPATKSVARASRPRGAATGFLKEISLGKVRNILFIMADQLRWDHLSCYGHPRLQTPALA